MGWLSLLTLFAKPLGAAINNGISAAAGAAVLYAVQHGVDKNLALSVASPLVLAISTLISSLAATQGVQIPIINNDTTNGLVVVKASAASKAGIDPVPNVG